MKHIFTFLFITCSLLAGAQGNWPSVAITTMQVLPNPSYSTAPIRVVANVTAVHPCSAGVPSITVTNSVIMVELCYREIYPTAAPCNNNDTIVLGSYPPGSYTVDLRLYVDLSATDCAPNNLVQSKLGFKVLLGSSVAEQQKTLYNISPNPVKERILVSGSTSSANYRLMGFDGKVLEWLPIENGEINTAAISPGFYVLEIAAGETLYRQKVLKLE